jgi:polynucleotide 5'-hydroxyl-kinase GRC3/NOL9
MTIQRLLAEDFFGSGAYLYIGAADTGKTTLVSATAAQLASKRRVAVVDADTGQSHIGPPATVGWAIAKADENDLTKLSVSGIAFVGEISPVGHLLQMTGAIVQCVRQALTKVTAVLIDTPGFVSGPAACALWWEVTRMVQPKAIIAVQRQNELGDIIRGLENCGSVIGMIECSDEVKSKSPEQRKAYRQRRFAEYFAKASIIEIDLKGTAVQAGRRLDSANAPGLLVGLRDSDGTDLAMGFIVEWREAEKVILKSPAVNPEAVRSIVVGDATVDLPM